MTPFLHDPDTGLLRFGFRDYDPDIGGWTAKDPIGFAENDTNLYGYCLNDPVNWVDPVGLCLTPSQKIKVSIISGIGSTVGLIIGGGPLGSAIGGAVAGGFASLIMGGGWRDIANNAISGLLSGFVGGGIGNMLMWTSMSGMQVALTTGFLSGMTSAALLGASPVIPNPCP